MSFKMQLLLHVTPAMVTDKQIEGWREQQTEHKVSETHDL